RDLNLARNRLRDFGLEGEHVPGFAIVGAGPEMIVAFSPDQLCADADTAPGAYDGALDDSIDAQRFRDFWKRLARMLELHDGRSRDHTNALHARQAFDQCFRHAVDKEVLAGVA